MQPFAGNYLMTSALSFAVQRLKHCPLVKTSGPLVFYDQHLQHRRKSAEQKPGLSHAVSKAQSFTKGRSHHSIIRPQVSVERCTAKDNADVTKSYQQTVAFMHASMRRL